MCVCSKLAIKGCITIHESKDILDIGCMPGGGGAAVAAHCNVRVHYHILLVTACLLARERCVRAWRGRGIPS
jgi:hypothetical protein